MDTNSPHASQDSYTNQESNWLPNSHKGGSNKRTSQISYEKDYGKSYELRNRKDKNYGENDDTFEYDSYSFETKGHQTIDKYLRPNYRENSDSLIDTDFEESLRYFEYSMDRARAYWVLPLRSLLESEAFLNLESLVFPYAWKKRWRFIAEIQKDEAGLKKVYIGIEAILSEEEMNDPEWQRDVKLSLRVTLKLGSLNVEKSFNRVYDSQKSDFGFQIPDKVLPDINLLHNDRLIIEVIIKENKMIKMNEKAEYLGLINSGNLCYMNSFLQTLYQLTVFARKLLLVPVEFEKDTKLPIITAMQRLFYSLKCGKKAVSTQELIKSFGWDKKQASFQQDIQEFCLLLMEAIEKRLKGIDKFENVVSELFEGKVLNYINCVDVDFKSEQPEKFIELQLNVQNNSNIYECLDQYTTEEVLDGDNRYDAEGYGKQKARKGVKILSLPPIFMVQMKRFEYDYEKDANVKITDYCEYYEEIDLEKYIIKDKHDDETKYKLFSVLVHKGTGAGSGHYYAFIRPSMGNWFKFNDDVVTLAEPEEVFDENFGGMFTEARLSKNKDIESWESPRMSSAYMLVYIRADMTGKYLRPLTHEDIPRSLINEIEATKRAEEERKRKNEDFVKIYLTSFDLLKDINTPGLTFYRMGNNDKDFDVRFFKKTKHRRLKIYVRKNYKVSDLMEFISQQTNIPQEQLFIWKIRINKEQITPVTRRTFLTSGGTGVQILANGPGSNSTKSIFFVHPVNRKKYPHIFKGCDPYHTNYFGIKCKNHVKFKEYSAINQEIYPKADIIDELTEPMIIQRAGQQMLDLMDDKYLLVFVKAYSCPDGKPNVKLFDYFYIKKTELLKGLVAEVQLRYKNQLEFEAAKYFKEDKTKYTLEELQLDDKLDDESDDFGLFIVISFPSDRADYIQPTEHYEALQDRTWVQFIAGSTKEKNEPHKALLSQQIFHQEVLDYISTNILDGQVPPNKIIAKCKFKGSHHFIPIPTSDMADTRLGEMVKYDDRIYFEISKIDIDQLDKKLKCPIYYFSHTTNRITPEEELFIDKDATITDVINEINNKNIFLQERLQDVQDMNNEPILRIIVLDKKNLIVGRAVMETGVDLYLKKQFKLRAEYIPTEYEKKDGDDHYYPIYGVHITKDGHQFSNTFVTFSKKSAIGAELRLNLYNLMKNWDIDCAGKEIKMTEEYYSKLRIILKANPSDQIYCRVDNDEVKPLQEVEERAKKFYLEIIHPLNLPVSYQQQMKIGV